MAKCIDKLTVELGVEDVQSVILKTLGMTKSTLIEWREIMASHGYQGRAGEVQKYVDMIVKASGEEDQ